VGRRKKAQADEALLFLKTIVLRRVFRLIIGAAHTKKALAKCKRLF